MDSVKRCGDKDTSSSLYYGVYTPNENKDYNSAPNIFQDKAEALKVAKKNKKSRFKAFQFYHEAAEFSLNGSDFPNNNTSVNGPLIQKPPPETSSLGEKASPFKGPKPQELVELRKAIEAGNYDFVKEIIWQNPRYLVSSGDTPAILQEGPRYNAMHVAAKSKNAEIAELILSTVSNTEFIKLLYGDDNQQNADDRTSVLLDLYLNTPNKGLNETPLHFASKHGAVDVVEMLVSYPQCDKTLKNKYNKTADQMICERAEGKNVANDKRKIEILLQDSYYVPVLRAEDRSLPPAIGEPFSPTNPPVLSKDPLSPRMEIHAYAGPMDKKCAQEFRKIWKTPPRSLNFCSPDQRKPSQSDAVSAVTLRFKDPDKGLERIGKKLAKKYDVNWKEYWPFLGSFIDISSEEGLNLFESHLANRYAILNNVIAEDSIKSTSDVCSVKEDVLSPMADLCAAFSACHLNDNKYFNDSSVKKSDIESISYIDKACQVFANRISNDILYTLCNDEKLLEVLETEIKMLEVLTSYSDMLSILRNKDILQVLETEIKQLELLTTSYMDDSRFASVNFQKIHSRLGLWIGRKLYNNIKEEVRIILFNKLENVLERIIKSVDCFSSDDESHNYKDSSEQSRKPTIYRKQLICLMRYILNVLSQNYDMKQIYSEGDIKDWENAESCSCIYHARKFKKNNLSRNNSFKNSSKIFSRTEPANTPRRLNFEEGDDDTQLYVQNGLNISKNHYQSDASSCDGSGDDNEDTFYTPPSSPSLLLEDVESEDDFNDTELPKYDIFIDGELPTKIDCDVFNAINYSEVKLNSKQYPNIYKWYHTVSLYTNTERQSWPNVKGDQKTKSDSPISLNSSFDMLDSPKTSTPCKSWLRITGTNSPKALLKARSIH